MMKHTLIARFMGPTWGPPGFCRPQMGPILAPWTLLSGYIYTLLPRLTCTQWWLDSAHQCPGHLARSESLSAFAAADRDSMVWFRRKTMTYRQTAWNCVSPPLSTRNEGPISIKRPSFNIQIPVIRLSYNCDNVHDEVNDNEKKNKNNNTNNDFIDNNVGDDNNVTPYTEIIRWYPAKRPYPPCASRWGPFGRIPSNYEIVRGHLLQKRISYAYKTKVFTSCGNPPRNAAPLYGDCTSPSYKESNWIKQGFEFRCSVPESGINCLNGGFAVKLYILQTI